MLPPDFNPSDPNLWKLHNYAYDSATEPDEGLLELGFTRKELLAILWLRALRNVVVKQGLSLFITVDGRHRSGKSRFITVMNVLMSEEFGRNMKKYIVTDADALLNLVEYIDTNNIANPIITVDEAGSALNSADWYERIQKAIIKTMTIIGYLHPTIIFIAPIKDLVLSGIRKMSHVHMKITRGNNQYACIIPYEVHYNSMKGKAYFKKFVVKLFGQPIKINAVRATLPPKEIDDAYGAIEKERKPIMLKDIRADAMKAEIKQKREVIDYNEISDFVVKNIEFFKAENNKPDHFKVDWNLLRAKFKTTQNDAKLIQRMAERKLNGGLTDVQKSQDVKGDG